MPFATVGSRVSLPDVTVNVICSAQFPASGSLIEMPASATVVSSLVLNAAGSVLTGGTFGVLSGRTVVGSSSLLLAVLVSPPPATVAVLTRSVASAATFTVTGRDG